MKFFCSYKICYQEPAMLTVQEPQAIFGTVVNFLYFW